MAVAYAAAVPALLTIEEAQARILAAVHPLEPERVALAEAHGRVLADDALAPVDLPPFPSSSMDGFAVRGADVPGSLAVVERVAAGSPTDRRLNPGEAIAVATGGVVPDGADAVVPIEHVVDNDNTIEITRAVAPQENIRPIAGDVARDAVVVPAGTRLAAAQLGALAAAGIADVACSRRPRVAVLATGTELRAPGERLERGQIYEANTTLLDAGLTAAGAAVTRLAMVADDAAAHRDAIAAALEHDVAVTSGGVSVGPHDLVRRVARELGVTEVFWGVAAKPGKPLSFGVRGTTLVFGLPGNPVSTLVGAELFVKPALLALQRARDPLPRFFAGILATSVRRNPHRDELVRARSSVGDDGVTVEPLAGQESHMIVRASAADALVLVPRGDGEIAEGAPVRYLALG